MDIDFIARDRALMCSYRNGNYPAFEQFYGYYKDKIFQYMYGVSGCIFIAEDLASEAWTRLIHKHHLIKSDGSPFHFLMAICRSSIADHYRSPRTRTNQSTSSEIDLEGLESPNNLSSTLEVQEMIKSLSTLPLEQREAVLLKHLAGMTLQEVAEYQQSNLDSVKSRIRYGMYKLRKSLSIHLRKEEF